MNKIDCCISYTYHLWHLYITIYTFYKKFVRQLLCLHVMQKALQLPFFLLFVFLLSVFGCTAKNFSASVLRSVTKEACDQYLTHSLNNKKYFCKNCFWHFYSECLRHMTQFIHHNQHSQYPKKQKKWSKTEKQVIQQLLVCSRWQKIQGSKNRKKSSWYVKKSEDKEKMFKRSNWLVL